MQLEVLCGKSLSLYKYLKDHFSETTLFFFSFLVLNLCRMQLNVTWKSWWVSGFCMEIQISGLQHGSGFMLHYTNSGFKPDHKHMVISVWHFPVLLQAHSGSTSQPSCPWCAHWNLWSLKMTSKQLQSSWGLNQEDVT